MFTIDGMTWDYPCKITRKAEMTASEISGLLMDKSYFNDVIGTYMSYDVTIAIPVGRESEYLTIYEALTNPVDGHAFVLPYDGGMISITARVASVTDDYIRLPGGGITWKGTRFTVVANHPTKTMSLDEVITRGASPLPEASSVNVGAVYQYTSGGWTELDDADDIYW